MNTFVPTLRAPLNCLRNRLVLEAQPRYHMTKFHIPTPAITSQQVRFNTGVAGASSASLNNPANTIRRIDEGPSLVSTKIPEELAHYPFLDSKDVVEKLKHGDVKPHIFLVDFETTGISKKELPRIIELSAKYLGGGVVSDANTQKHFYAVIDPGIASTIYAYEYHQIKRSEVRGKPSIDVGMKNFVDWVGTIVAKNDPKNFCVFLTTNFSKTEKITLGYEFSRSKVEAPSNWVFVNATNILDAVLIDVEKAQKIETIYMHLFGELPAKQHRSEADVKILQDCLTKVFTDDAKFHDQLVKEMEQGDPSKMI